MSVRHSLFITDMLAYRTNTMPITNSAWRLTRAGMHPWVLGTAKTPSTNVHLMTLKKIKGTGGMGTQPFPWLHSFKILFFGGYRSAQFTMIVSMEMRAS